MLQHFLPQMIGDGNGMKKVTLRYTGHHYQKWLMFVKSYFAVVVRRDVEDTANVLKLHSHALPFVYVEVTVVIPIQFAEKFMISRMNLQLNFSTLAKLWRLDLANSLISCI